jgi:hypothetical protein
MTRHVWTKIFIAGLIFLGDVAYAAENSVRSDIEAAASDITSQISKQTFLDNAESKWKPATNDADTATPVIFSASQLLASISFTTSEKFKYHPLNSRAPPLPSK